MGETPCQTAACPRGEKWLRRASPGRCSSGLRRVRVLDVEIIQGSEQAARFFCCQGDSYIGLANRDRQAFPPPQRLRRSAAATR